MAHTAAKVGAVAAGAAAAIGLGYVALTRSAPVLLQVNSSAGPVNVNAPVLLQLEVSNGTPGGAATFYISDAPTTTGARVVTAPDAFDDEGNVAYAYQVGVEGTYYIAAVDVATGHLSNWVEVIAGTGPAETLGLLVNGSSTPVQTVLLGHTVAITVFGGIPGDPGEVVANARPTLAGATSVAVGVFNGQKMLNAVYTMPDHTVYIGATDTETGEVTNWIQLQTPTGP